MIFEMLLAQTPLGPKPLPVNPEIIVRAAEASSSAAQNASIAAILAGITLILCLIIGAIVTYLAAKSNIIIYGQKMSAKHDVKMNGREKERVTE